eukprot:s19_g17.t1
MSLDKQDAFKDLQFNGQPSGYRDFRRKTILAVAGLEDKHAYLAGPRLLSRLSGEAWRATEHLQIAELRKPDGWLSVIKALDAHYRYLPETELHEAIEEFLFMLKRRPNEGATSFSSRFRTQLDRVQTLIAQERETTRQKRRRRNAKGSKPQSEASSLEESIGDDDIPPAMPPDDAPASASDQDQVPEFDPFGQEAEQPAAAAEGEHAPPPSAHGRAATDPIRSKPPSTIGTGTERGSKRRHKATSHGTFERDHAESQKRMQHMLGTLEVGHLTPRPILPQSVLGHLYMRKYGLSRDQRAQIIRATNGSSRFKDVERIMRASDLEEIAWRRSASTQAVTP